MQSQGNTHAKKNITINGVLFQSSWLETLHAVISLFQGSRTSLFSQEIHLWILSRLFDMPYKTVHDLAISLRSSSKSLSPLHSFLWPYQPCCFANKLILCLSESHCSYCFHYAKWSYPIFTLLTPTIYSSPMSPPQKGFPFSSNLKSSSPGILDSFARFIFIHSTLHSLYVFQIYLFFICHMSHLNICTYSRRQKTFPFYSLMFSGPRTLSSICKCSKRLAD